MPPSSDATGPSSRSSASNGHAYWACSASKGLNECVLSLIGDLRGDDPCPSESASASARVSTLSVHTMEEAVAVLRPSDSLTIPLGPGQPAALLHALGERDDWQDLQVLGALLVDLYPLFTKPNVHYRSGFFGLA